EPRLVADAELGQRWAFHLDGGLVAVAIDRFSPRAPREPPALDAHLEARKQAAVAAGLEHERVDPVVEQVVEARRRALDAHRLARLDAAQLRRHRRERSRGLFERLLHGAPEAADAHVGGVRKELETG